MEGTERELASFALPARTIEKLSRAGMFQASHLMPFQLSPSSLARESGLTAVDAQATLKIVFDISRDPQSFTSQSALALLRAGPRKRIITLSQEVDVLMGGGIGVGEVTEICGVPGVGKTQFCMQLALNVQIPTQIDGQGGSAIFIDTEGSFSAQRIHEMARSLHAQLQRIPAKDIEFPTVATMLSRVHIYRVHDHTEQISLLRNLPTILSSFPSSQPVRLVAIDSIAFHFRYCLSEDVSQRSRLMYMMARLLTSIAAKHSVAVVVVNQVTTRILNGMSRVVPALGEGWAHTSSTRALLFWEGNERRITLLKSPDLPAKTAAYDVTAAGIRDIQRRAQNGEL